MMTWNETRKKNFKWNQYVDLYVDGNLVGHGVQVRDTYQYDEYEVDDMFGYNKFTFVKLVTPNH